MLGNRGASARAASIVGQIDRFHRPGKRRVGPDGWQEFCQGNGETPSIVLVDSARLSIAVWPMAQIDNRVGLRLRLPCPERFSLPIIMTRRMTHPPSHRLGGCLSILPGAFLVLYALLADVAAGRDLVADWGTGQTVFVVLGVLAMAFGWTLHRKAVADESAGKRRYNRTIVFLLVPAVVFLIGPLVLAEVAARIFYAPPKHGSSYHRLDPRYGVVLDPDRVYQVSSDAKDFDVTVHVDSSGHRYAGDPVAVKDSDVFVIGDSHPFGWGVDEDETLPAQLAEKLQAAGRPSRVINAGVPGYGPVQSLLRIEDLAGKLREDATVVLFINPVNDMVNLSMEIDYRYPKPHAVMDGAQLLVVAPPADGEGLPYRFSPAFEALNRVFAQEVSEPVFQSVLYRWIAGTDVPPESPTVDGVTIMKDETTPEKYLADDRQRILARPSHYAARFWTEMEGLDEHRETLRAIATGVFSRLKRSTDAAGWNLIVVLAPEALHHQAYSIDFIKQVDAAWPANPVMTGWTREMLKLVCDEIEITTVTWDDVTVEPERSYVQNDDHTSAIGHGYIADALLEKMVGDADE